MKPQKSSQIKYRILLGLGALVALTLCIQCVRTYLYTVAVLVPRQAEDEAERQSAALSTAARNGSISDPQALGPVIEHLLATSADRVSWMRVLNSDGKVLAQGGSPQGSAKIPARWWDSVQKHEPLAVPINTPQGEMFVAMLPLRIRPPHQFDTASHPAPGSLGHPPTYVLELAIPYKTVAGAFEQLRQNLFMGVIASIALLFSIAVIGLRAPHYFRGKYLESELQLARRVQNDLQPKPSTFSSNLEFAAAAIAADHIGGDFYDIFEADHGKIVFVLGDVSGKGVSAALLVSVLQGAIRSSSVLEHEVACERINRMFCERTACERFATLFWGVFDPASATLRYVNAGHSAPFLIRRQHNDRTVRLDQGGAVLGLLPAARYTAGTAKLEAGDMLIISSDGISEAENHQGEQFGEDRIQRLGLSEIGMTPSELCQRVIDEVTMFACAEIPPDDRTLLVVRFPHCDHGSPALEAERASVEAAA